MTNERRRALERAVAHAAIEAIQQVTESPLFTGVSLKEVQTIVFEAFCALVVGTVTAAEMSKEETVAIVQRVAKSFAFSAQITQALQVPAPRGPEGNSGSEGNCAGNPK